MNKRMPEVIDAETRLDRVSAEPGLHFSYHYTLTASSSTAIDKASFSSTIRAQLKGKLCDSVQIRSFFNHGVTVGYLYQGNDGLPVGGADFAPDSCDGAKEPASNPEAFAVSCQFALSNKGSKACRRAAPSASPSH